MKKEKAIVREVIKAAEAITADAVVFGTSKQWRSKTRALIEDAVANSNFGLELLEDL